MSKSNQILMVLHEARFWVYCRITDKKPFKKLYSIQI